MSGGVWIPQTILTELGAGTAAVYAAQLAYRCHGDADAVVIRADHEWGDAGLTRRQVQRARVLLVERGWMTTEVRLWNDKPIVHSRLSGPLHQMVQTGEHRSVQSTSSSNTNKQRRGRREVGGQRRMWPHAVGVGGADPVYNVGAPAPECDECRDQPEVSGDYVVVRCRGGCGNWVPVPRPSATMAQ